MFRQLAYCAPGSFGLPDNDVAALVERRRTACAVLGATGALLHTDGNVFELLEGSDAAVARLSASLSTELLLREAIVLMDRPVPQRWYLAWRATRIPQDLFDTWMAELATMLAAPDALAPAVKRFIDEGSRR
jgi:hypothetical protein